MRPIWKGSISFGLVSIPVSVVNATKAEELKFRLLRKHDLSPVNYKRVAQVDGKEVPWDEIVKGYEYAKGKFVVLQDEDFQRVDLEATDTIDIMEFVPIDSVDPVYFHRPYYLEPQKGGAPAYHLLRQVLADTNKAGIAKVVIRTRQHLAAVKAKGDLLVLELMRFAKELVPTSSLNIPREKAPGAKAAEMARTLVEQMTEKWDPSRYTDDYRSALMKLIDKKVRSGGKALPKAPSEPKHATNVIDLASVLQESLRQAGSGRGKSAKKPARKSARRAA